MIIGLDIWFGTLQSKEGLLNTWNSQSVTTQSLLQEQLSCCGYFNSTSIPAFVTDSTCPNAIVAATMPGCSAAFVKLDGLFLDVIFTAAFGIVGMFIFSFLSVSLGGLRLKLDGGEGGESNGVRNCTRNFGKRCN